MTEVELMEGVRREPFDVGVAGCLAAVEVDLGRLRRQYRGWLVPSPVRPALAVANLVLGTWLIREGVSELLAPGPVSPGARAFLGLVAAAGLAAGALGGVLLHGFCRPGEWWFGHFDDGVIVSREGRQPVAIPWEHLTRVTCTPATGALAGAKRAARREVCFFFAGGGPYRLKRLPAADWGSIGPEVVEAFGRFAALAGCEDAPQTRSSGAWVRR